MGSVRRPVLGSTNHTYDSSKHLCICGHSTDQHLLVPFAI